MRDWIQSLTISKGGMWLLAEYENKRLNSEHIQQDVVDSTKCTQKRRCCRLQRNAPSEVPVRTCFCHWHSEIFKSTFYVTTCFIKHSWLLNKHDEIDQENMENRKTYYRVNTDRNKIVLRGFKKVGRDQPCTGENGILSVSTIGRQKLPVDTNSRENTKINWYWPHPTTLHKGHRGRGDDDLVLTEKQTTYLFVWLQDVWAWHRDNDVDLVNDVERLILNLVGQEGHVDQLTQCRFLESPTNIHNIPHTHIMQSASSYTSILFHKN